MRVAWPLVAAATLLSARLPAQAATDTGARPISLEEAVRLAQAAAPAAVQARGVTEASVAGLRSAYASFIPSLSLNASTAAHSPAGAAVTNPVTGQLVSGKWQVTQGFTLAVDIFDGGRRLYDLSSARALLGAAEAGEVVQRYQIAYNVKVQYYAVLASHEQRAAAEAALDAAIQQLKVSVTNVLARTVTKSDSLRSLVAVGNARLQMLAADLALEQANATLTRLVAAPRPVTAIVGDSSGDAIGDVDSVAIARLVLTSPTIRQADANRSAAVASARASRSAYFPALSVSYGRTRTAVDTTFNVWCCGGLYSGQLRFSLSYPIFNQWTRESNVVLADVTARNADAQARDARYAAQESLVQYLGALRTAQQQVAIQAISVAAAQEDLRVQTEQYKLGVSTILDVLTSQSSLNAARLLLIQARYTYRVAKAQLEALVGRELRGELP